MTTTASRLSGMRESAGCDCGARLPKGASFCHACGTAARNTQSSAVTSRLSTVARRFLAEIIDRLIPLPFIAYFFPPWVFAVVAYHLICDGAPSGRGPGKWLFRLRVVTVSSKQPCGICRAALRRLPTALGQAALVSVGFDPYLGFLHSLDYGRCSLALDLIEELRALIADRLVLNVTNLEVVKANDFTGDGVQGIQIKDAARKRFLNEYERLMTAEFPHRRTGERMHFRRVLHDQALAMQRTVQQGVPYQPFRGWH